MPIACAASSPTGSSRERSPRTDGINSSYRGERTSRPLMRGVSRAVARPSGRDVRSPSTMKRICVFCGSNRGAREEYADAARVLAGALVRDDLTLVYGGGRVGLMGVIADEVLRLGGRAIGVIPRPLWDREVGHANLTEV